MFLKLARSTSLQTLCIILLFLSCRSFLHPIAPKLFYTISLVIKDLLVWLMPLTVCAFIAHAIYAFDRKAPFFVLLLLIFEFCSNFTSVWYAFFSASSIAPHISDIKAVAHQADFHALVTLPFQKPAWWSADKGFLAGLTLGFLMVFTKNQHIVKGMGALKETMELVLTRFFRRLIPLFILGFLAQILETQLIQHVVQHYVTLLAYLLCFLGAYLGILLLISTNFSLRKAAQNLRHLLPATGIALTSGCSLSTMPWTIAGAAKNLENPELAKAIIPATTNIQQIGDCITNTFLCFLLYRYFNGHNPDTFMWLQFSLVFVLARYATAAVIGGAIFLMLPIYETYLHFNGEMIATILAFNVLLDPLVTSSNVLANGILCRVFEKVWNALHNVKLFQRLARLEPTPELPSTGP